VQTWEYWERRVTRAIKIMGYEIDPKSFVHEGGMPTKTPPTLTVLMPKLTPPSSRNRWIQQATRGVTSLGLKVTPTPDRKGLVIQLPPDTRVDPKSLQ
jgi:hypothetical protein